MNQFKRLRKSGSQECLVKKNKVTSQITTLSMSKKNNKTVYCHHDDDDDDDDSYAKDRMIIERVNDDCLAEIFMYVPAWERPKIAWICKKWKRIIDDAWFNVKKLELTYWEYDDPHFLKKNYPTLDRRLNFLKSVLHKCGRYLRELDLSVYPKCDIVPVINEYCPNLEILQIRIRLYDDEPFNNAFTNLSKLKVLKIILHECFCTKWASDYIALIESLLNVADTLTDLFVSNWTRCLNETLTFPEEMTSVVSQLKALRKFVTYGVGCSKSLRDYLNNSKTIETICDYTGIIANKFDTHSWKYSVTPFYYMEVLNIINWQITDNGIYAIANTMERLHTLDVSCSWLTDAGIATCTKINNLKCLGFYGSNNTTDSSIKLLRNMRELRVPRSNKITDESAIKVLENSPDMQNFNVMYTGITYKFIEKAAEISRNREKQLKILVTLECDMSTTQVEYEYLTVDYDKKE